MAAPVLLMGAFTSFATYLILKKIVARRPGFMRKQHHLVGIFATLMILDVLVCLEASFVPATILYDVQVFDSHIKHHFIVAIYIAISSTYTGMSWCYVAAVVSVLGNYLTLTFGYSASPGRFLTNLAAYGTCALNATIEAYLMERKSRDVFLMETIVANASAVKPGAVQLERTADLVADIRKARLQRQCVSEAGMTDGSAGPETRDIEQIETDLKTTPTLSTPLAFNSSVHLRGSSSMQGFPQADIRAPLPEEPSISVTEPEHTKPEVVEKQNVFHIHNVFKGLPRRIKQFFRRRWKNIYLAWADEYHEASYLQWQNKTFGRVYGLAMAIQCVSLISHVLLDKNSFCREGTVQESLFMCDDPGPTFVQNIYLLVFVPMLLLGLGVALGPTLNLRPAITHRCAAFAFVNLFGAYSWLTIKANKVKFDYEGSQYPDDMYEVFDAYAFNVLIAAAGALPSHWFHILIGFALVEKIAHFALGLTLQIVLYDVVLLLCLLSTSGGQVTTSERLARRHHALRSAFLDRCRHAGIAAEKKIRKVGSFSALLAKPPRLKRADQTVDGSPEAV
ncbi:hypothetical protein HDU87_006885 [Geranomyces variabilis]|uniref:Uncharacterized protein n=1 Tax=Geranomyces variabilis TaxID=109894 RepID=A0AAD5XKT5_9FUNG|nr:hypothetical protein HDU87_006885 [Geranomyces variabilis]